MTLSCLAPEPGRPPPAAVIADSLVVDLFSLGARLRLRADNARLTPRGASLLTDSAPAVEGENVVLALDGRRVRTFSAYARHDRDMACHPSILGEEALLVLLDDGLESPCRDTTYAWVPAYPYRVPVAAAYLDGKGFWISAGEIPFARGALIIHYDYFTERPSYD